MQTILIIHNCGIAEQEFLDFNLGLIRVLYLRPRFLCRDNLCRTCLYSSIAEQVTLHLQCSAIDNCRVVMINDYSAEKTSISPYALQVLRIAFQVGK